MSSSIVWQGEMAPGVQFVQGPASNWVVLVGGGEVALVDAGYPADLPLVEESIRRAGGRPEDLASILVTHGHSDHIGSIAALVERYGPRVFGHPDELPNITRTELHQIGVGDILPRVWRPRVARWTVHAIRAGGLGDVGVRTVQPLPDGLQTVAGQRIEAVPIPGHTPGHTAYLLPDAGILITGDALVTAHPTTAGAGPQLLARMWHTDPDAALANLQSIAAIPARLILPGHGPLIEASPAFVVAEALRRTQR
ncbi:MBL fold metallo-hydrolase [Leifsonia sp. NPDC058230]|uniref:MBL fold metallo-hydrolase n=1 Tax=Leifsonia sp. NPDC058230 TaxID=3346391 RepID=UPI0036DDCE48